jgi:membrane-bound lytic murein transglycosylase A
MRLLRAAVLLLGVSLLVACSSGPGYYPAVVPAAAPVVPEAAGRPSAPINAAPGGSRWVAVQWSDLPGFDADPLFEAWNAWLKSCERPGPVFAPLCPEIRRLSIGGEDAQRQWMLQHLQPFRVEQTSGNATGLLTAYFEPEFEARRLPSAEYDVPLYQLPTGMHASSTWFTRQEIDTLAQAKAALTGREIAYLADPVQALLLQIQGSGRLRITESDGQQRLVRLAFAGHNGQPYKSIGRWLMDQGELRDGSWPGISAWMLQNPQRVRELLWQNPRVVFFQEEALSEFDRGFGPRGAQGVPLTPGRSIAVDPQSIPYGTPVWLSSEGPQASFNKLVLAQDTGSAIRGAVRADYFAGWGVQAGELAGRLKQPLRLWVLWPKPGG